MYIHFLFPLFRVGSERTWKTFPMDYVGKWARETLEAALPPSSLERERKGWCTAIDSQMVIHTRTDRVPVRVPSVKHAVAPAQRANCGWAHVFYQYWRSIYLSLFFSFLFFFLGHHSVGEGTIRLFSFNSFHIQAVRFSSSLFFSSPNSLHPLHKFCERGNTIWIKKGRARETQVKR